MRTENNAEVFVKHLANNPSFQERFQNGDAETLLEWAKSEGYEFSVTELQAALAAIAPQEKGLDEEQLGKVNGGGFLKTLGDLLKAQEKKSGAIND